MTAVRVTVLLTVLPTVAADCLLAVEFDDAAVTLVAVVLPLDTDDDELTLLAVADWDDVLLTLLELAMPPLVETLLVNTLSEPVSLRFPCQRSS